MNFDVMRSDGTVDAYRDDGPLVHEYAEHVDGSVLVYTTHRGSHGRLIGPRHTVRLYGPDEARHVREL